MKNSMELPKDCVVVGVDLGATNMQIGVVNAEGKIIGRCKRKTKARCKACPCKACTPAASVSWLWMNPWTTKPVCR